MVHTHAAMFSHFKQRKVWKVSLQPIHYRTFAPKYQYMIAIMFRSAMYSTFQTYCPKFNILSRL